MDQMELRSGKALVKVDQKEDSDDDPEKGIQKLLEEGYAVGGNDAKKLTPLEE